MRPPAATAVVAICLLAIALPAAAQEGAAPAARFAAVDVILDNREPVAAWQFELVERNGLMTVVGVENGDSAAFADAPHYDLDAVRRGTADRIIVADYSLRPAAGLPTGSTRIATIHVRLNGPQAPDYQLRLIAAGDATGRAVDAAISLRTPTGRGQ